MYKVINTTTRARVATTTDYNKAMLIIAKLQRVNIGAFYKVIIVK